MSKIRNIKQHVENGDEAHVIVDGMAPLLEEAFGKDEPWLDVRANTTVFHINDSEDEESYMVVDTPFGPIYVYESDILPIWIPTGP